MSIYFSKTKVMNILRIRNGLCSQINNIRKQWFIVQKKTNKQWKNAHLYQYFSHCLKQWLVFFLLIFLTFIDQIQYHIIVFQWLLIVEKHKSIWMYLPFKNHRKQTLCIYLNFMRTFCKNWNCLFQFISLTIIVDMSFVVFVHCAACCMLAYTLSNAKERCIKIETWSTYVIIS